ncbi:MAG: YihA family ribosome biogenesis GTP-binding protein [Magnetococcales bacterium]|nr:YihA family ribosome biogenesis GTP-binding protein [Magnetococcales bacterium]
MSPTLIEGWPARLAAVGATAAQFPVDQLPEIAFVGRSNCGKSSLLNRLVNQRHLARVSKRPGCTRDVLFFHVWQRWYFVDLPGYGFARIDQRQRAVWERGIGHYLSQRRQLRAVILLFDLRRGVTDIDQQMLNYLGQHGIPFLPVATKSDQLGSNDRRQALTRLTGQLQQPGYLAIAAPLAVSSLNGTGMPELRQMLHRILAGEGDGTGSD